MLTSPAVIQEVVPKKTVSRSTVPKKRPTTPTVAFGGGRERNCMISYDVF